MREFTLVMAYYENHLMLLEHCRQWQLLPAESAAHLHVVIVDDGSPTRPALNAVRSFGPVGLASLQVWRMKIDLPWNQDACRNLGAKHAPTDWLVLTDMDHIVPPRTWLNLMSHPLDEKTAYRFARVSAPQMEPYKPHPNSWAMSRQTFWRCGGYDERLAGNYGTDGDFLVRVRRQAEIIDLRDVLIRVPREVIPDASTTTLVRKQPQDKENIRRLLAERSYNADWRPIHFSFPHERVL